MPSPFVPPLKSALKKGPSPSEPPTPTSPFPPAPSSALPSPHGSHSHSHSRSPRHPSQSDTRSRSRSASVHFTPSPVILGPGASFTSQGSGSPPATLSSSVATSPIAVLNSLPGGVPVATPSAAAFPGSGFTRHSPDHRSHSGAPPSGPTFGPGLPFKPGSAPPTPLFSTHTSPTTTTVHSPSSAYIHAAAPVTVSANASVSIPATAHSPPSLSSYDRPFGSPATMQYSYGAPPNHPAQNPPGSLGMPPSPRIPLSSLGQPQGHHRSPSVGPPTPHGHVAPPNGHTQPFRVAAPSGRLRPEDPLPPPGSIGARRYSIGQNPPSPYVQPLLPSKMAQPNAPAAPPPPPAAAAPMQPVAGSLAPGPAHGHARNHSADISSGMRRLSISRHPPSPHTGTLPTGYPAPPPAATGYPSQSPRVGGYGVPPSPRVAGYPYPPSPHMGTTGIPPPPGPANVHPPSPHGVSTHHSPRGAGAPSPHLPVIRPSAAVASEYSYPVPPVPPTAVAAPSPYDRGYSDAHLYPDPGAYGRPRSHSAAAAQGYPLPNLPHPPPPSSAMIRPPAHSAAPSVPPSPHIAPKKVIVISAAIESAATEIAQQMARSSPDWAVLMKRLPGLTDDQLSELRAAYRKISTGHNQVSLPRQIKSKFPGPIGRALYATSLGRYESEIYWLSVWTAAQPATRCRHDGDIVSPELVVESLLGRDPDDLDTIQECHGDRTAGSNLLSYLLGYFRNVQQYHPYQNTQYAHTRLPLPDSGLAAALSIALTAERQDESDVWPEQEILTDRDALRRALMERDHHTLLRVILTRSDRHLRLVLRSYEQIMGRSFARDALDATEGQLTKEIIAHILNGAMNRPAREVLLLKNGIDAVKQAVVRHRSVSRQRSARDRATQVDRVPTDLLTSRVIRLHWDRSLLAKVKADFRASQHRSVETAIRDAMGGELGDYLIRLLGAGEADETTGLLPTAPAGTSGHGRGRRGSFF